MKQTLTFTLLLLAIAAGALVFRLPRLDDRPMHADEAVQASIFRKLWLQGTYIYDPFEYHGPTLPYATLPAVWATAPQSFSETTAATYRIVPVAFGVGMVLLFGLFCDAVGRVAVLAAGLLAAISPAMVFYNRYFIHETLFVFFTLAMIASAWRYLRNGRLAWCLAAGVSAGLMQSTKETSVLTFVAAGTALALTWLWNRMVPSAASATRPRISRAHLVWGTVAFLFVSVTLLSSFFTNLRGPLDGVLTYTHWVRRASGGSPHMQPWYYFLEILACWKSDDGPVWSEGFILILAVIGIAATVLRTGRRAEAPVSLPFARWLSLYAILLTGIYTLLPYKTPWCLLSFHQALILLAGIGAVAVFPRTPQSVGRVGAAEPITRRVLVIALQVIMAAVFAGAGLHLAWQAYRANYVCYADSGNPYVHTPTASKIVELVHDMDELAKAAPEGHAVHVQVVWNDPYYWPLPWYLRGFERVGYWTEVPDGPGAPIVVSSPQLDAVLTEKLDETHLMTGYYAVRPNVLAQLWVRMDLWEAHLRRLGRL